MPAADSSVIVVSHFHWDREWYRTMQAFRARLVDAIDQVLALADADDGYRFLLDGQTVVLEDYLTVRPDRRDDLARHIRAGRLAIGPWYVQPDSLLPSGEAHVRNLLEGRRSGAPFGPVSQVAYVPDSFGHPAQFPQLFAGFGLSAFVHWRGNGSELDDLGSRWIWRAPDGTTLPVLHLTDGYFGAARPPDEPELAIASLSELVAKQRAAGESPVILMNGFDHSPPETTIAGLLDPLAAAVGGEVRRGTLDDAVAATSVEGRPSYAGELVGGRVANLLPGVWSARLGLKVRNRRCESLLQSWAEPWAALGAALGLPDESAALLESWRKLLRNQAHDSICGCSIDAVHDRMAARYDDAEGLADETVERVLQRLAGRPTGREVAGVDDLEVAVFNASARTTTQVVRIPLDAQPALAVRLGEPDIHSLVMAGLGDLGFAVDGVPVRVAASEDPSRVRWLPDQAAFDVEFIARDLVPFGCRRYRLTRAEPVPDDVDDGPVIIEGDTRVEVDDDGTLTLELGGRRWAGLFGVEDIGDRGDSYDFDPAGDPVTPVPVEVTVERRRHPSGIQRLTVRRRFVLPAALDDTRGERSSDTADVSLDVEVTLAPGVDGARAAVRVIDRAEDHRLRLRFPTGAPVEEFTAATTFDVASRTTSLDAGAGWVHPVPTTFCHQGHVTVNGLTVVAPGLPEAEVRADGEILLTLVRAVGWLSRYDLATRPIPAGPMMPAPGAQCAEELRVDIALLGDAVAGDAQATVTGVRGVIAGPAPLLADDFSLVALGDDALVVSALKPAADGEGIVIRVANPTGDDRDAVLRLGLPFAAAESVRLDETLDGAPMSAEDGELRFRVGAHGLRSVRIRP